MATCPALRHPHTPHSYHADAMEKIINVNPLGRKGVPGVGARIRAARHRAGLTIRVLSELAGVDDSSLTGWELESRDLSLAHLLALAAALGVPPRSLLPDAPLPPPQVLAGSFECPHCRTECAVLVTAMTPHSHNERTGRSDG